jgi:endonuclease-3
MPTTPKAKVTEVPVIDKATLTQIIELLDQMYPEAVTELQYQNPFQLLVAVILSAQCTDKRVNQITPALFERFPNPAALAAADFEEVFKYIKSISYPNNKTKHLIEMAQQLVNTFNGQVPKNRSALESLKGVGRKTANVLLSVLDNQSVMPVDTHVFRVSNRLGLTYAKNVRESENQLTALLPAEILPKAHHWLILHGRKCCHARKPNCSSCKLNSYCKYFQSPDSSQLPKYNKSAKKSKPKN